jgi:integrase/recombinase XerD
MTGTRPLGPLVHSFFLDHLVTVKGLRPASIRSYRDTIRLLLCFIAEQKGTKITKLGLEDLSFEQVLGFLRYLEDNRHNHVRTRNQRSTTSPGGNRRCSASASRWRPSP